MSRLTSKAPSSVEIGGIDYPISTDITSCILTISAIEDEDLTQYEKQDLLLYNMYEEVPHDIREAIERSLWFLGGGKGPSDKNEPKLSSFSFDGDMIYSAFLKSGVDLDVTDMHWWTFLSRYSELPESQFTRLVYLRMQYQGGKLTKEERKECDRIGWDVINMTTGEAPAHDDILSYINSE